jgi:hypothetical protein
VANTYQYLLLSWILPRPVWVLLKRVAIQHTPDVAAAARVLVVVPCSANTGALFYNDEVMALVAFDEVNGHAHSLEINMVWKFCFLDY